jgi:hypothetical protein
MTDNAIIPPGTPQPPEDVPVHEYTREQAQSALAKMAEDYRRANPGDEWTAGQEHATGELKRLEKETLKILADPVAAGLTGSLPSGTMVPFGPGEGQTIAAQKLQDTITSLRKDFGLSDPVIREALEPHKHSISPQEMEAVLHLESRLHGDAEWRKALLSGDQRAREQMTLIEVAKLLPVKAKT